MKRLNTRALCLALSLLALAAQPAAAVTFPDLYTLTVTPEPTAANPRAAAVDLAIRQLLARITGDRNAGSDPDLQALVANASQYVSSYAELDEERAQVGFYSSDIDRELESRNRPVWGPERPLTLLWVAIDGGQGERALLPADGPAVPGSSPEMTALTDSIRDELKAVAEERGLPITLPLLDLEDMAVISFADVWGGFDQSVEAASARYGADAVLIGRVRVTEFGNDVQWILLRNGQRRLLAGTEMFEGLHWLADTYAQDFSVLGGLRTVRILIRDVASLVDYGRAISYLEGLSALQAIDVESLEGDLLSLRVAARGDVGVLERMFTIGRVLQLADGFGVGSDASNTLVLRMARSEPSRSEPAPRSEPSLFESSRSGPSRPESSPSETAPSESSRSDSSSFAPLRPR